MYLNIDIIDSSPGEACRDWQTGWLLAGGKGSKQILCKLWASQSALCMQHRYLFRVRQQWDEIRNNDPLQPVIKRLGFVCSVQPQAQLLWSCVSADFRWLTHWHADYWTVSSFMNPMCWCGKCSTQLKAALIAPSIQPLCQYIFTPFALTNWPPCQCNTMA